MPGTDEFDVDPEEWRKQFWERRRQRQDRHGEAQGQWR